MCGGNKKIRNIVTRYDAWLRKFIPGSSRGSRRRNLLSYSYFALSVVLVLFLIVQQAASIKDSTHLQVGSIMVCMFAFVYFYLVVVAAVFLISDKFRINPVRLIRDIMISALYTICSFAFYYKQFGIVSPEPMVAEVSVLDYLYFSAVTFSTLGYGDFRPETYSRPLAALEALFGNLHLGLLAGAIFLLITEFSKKKA